ncbi:antistasin-like [Hydractinia symbiolongicarpus]|uniref:antistasin-like n=1 Tax=Hydractinia symbiolongicarpus TaxID=13093 RepID=UPI00254CD3EC|nr:antistasin-like [Hydractinia symbiolongicarpus]
MGSFRSPLVCLFVVVVVLWNIKQTTASSRCRCELRYCGRPTNCKGGIVKDNCGCCDVCAKQKGETCGGYAGVCEKGLVCRNYPHYGRRICSCGPVCAIYCQHGNILDKFGCATCKCRKFPRCTIRNTFQYLYGKRSFDRNNGRWSCIRKKSIFCTNDCNKCCHHNSSCRPNNLYSRTEKYCSRIYYK